MLIGLIFGSLTMLLLLISIAAMGQAANLRKDLNVSLDLCHELRQKLATTAAAAQQQLVDFSDKEKAHAAALEQATRPFTVLFPPDSIEKLAGMIMALMDAPPATIN